MSIVYSLISQFQLHTHLVGIECFWAEEIEIHDAPIPRHSAWIKKNAPLSFWAHQWKLT